MVPLRRARGVIKHLKSPDEMDLEEVRTTTMTAPSVCAWKEERTYKHTHAHTIPRLKTHLATVTLYNSISMFEH